MRRSRFLTIVSVLLSFLLLAASCGSDDEESDDSASESTLAEEAPTTNAATQGSTAEEKPAAVGCAGVDLSVAPDTPVNIRFGRGAGTEDQLYLMFLDPAAVGSQYNGSHYTMELTQFSPPDRLAAYQAGSLEAGTISAPQLFTAVASGLNIMAATSVAIVSENGGFTYPYAALGGNYQPGDDLTGSIIGIIAPNTSTEYWAKSAIARMGLDLNRDVSYVPVPPPNAEQALRDGQVDIEFFTASFWGLAQQEGGLTVVFDALTGPGFDHELLDVFFDRGFITENPVAYCAWRTDFVTANERYIASRASYGQTLIDNGYDAAPSAAIYAAREDAGRSADAAIDLADVQLLIDNMFEIGFLPSDLSVSAEDIVMEGFSLTK